MNNKKFNRKDNFDGSITYSPTSGVNFYNPFCLMKKDFKFSNSDDVTESFRSVLTTIEVFKNIRQDNRINTSEVMKIGFQFGMKETAVKNLINNMCKHSILIKISQGVYKLNESLLIFKQDHAGYLALQRETQAITNNTQNITNNINIMNPSETLLAKLLAKGATINTQNASDIEDL